MFSKICDIDIKRENGRIITNTPQTRYYNRRHLTLHQQGYGKFCSFRIPPGFNQCGVYQIKVNNEIKYIGECKNLSKRFNMGYGQISPRNCYAGGQPTNCRINKKILQEAKSGNIIELWFYQTDDFMEVERNLIQRHRPKWNIR